MNVIIRIVAIGLAILASRYGLRWTPDRVTSRLEQAQRQLVGGHSERAEAILRQILAHTTDRQIQADAQFQLALAVNDEYTAERTNETSPRHSADDAVREWKKFLVLAPKSLVGRNNLALATADAGDVAAAVDMLEKVVIDSASDVDQPFYMRNLADLQRRIGNADAAAKSYTQVLHQIPHEEHVTGTLVDLYTGRGDLGLNHLFALVNENAPAARFSVAAAVLGRPEFAGNDQATTQLALGLAETIETRGTEAARQQLSQIAGLDAAARNELDQLLRAQTGSTFSWWTADAEVRRKGFTSILDAMASRARSEGSRARALDLARMAAINASPGEATAVTPLIDLYIAQPTKISELDSVIDGFMARAGGILPSTLDAFKFHRAAGIANAEAGRWTDTNPQHAALPHLTRAKEIAQALGLTDPTIDFYLKNAPKEDGPATAQTAVRVIVATVHFGFNSPYVDCKGDPSIDAIGKYLRAHPATSLLAEGYTDTVGSSGYNYGLAGMRAEAVIQCIHDPALSKRLRPVSYGESRPLNDQNTGIPDDSSRRVECVVDAPNPMP